MLGLMTAMPEEAEALLGAVLVEGERIEHGRRIFHVGTLFGQDAVLVVSRCGKVAAATTATELVVRFGIDTLMFTGVAGALTSDLAPGDIVIADRLVQHDIDASPMWPPMVVPLLDIGVFETDGALTQRVCEAAERFAGEGGASVHVGPILSGDRFVKSSADVRGLLEAVPGALCVEMEGAAAAQVAYEYGVKLAVARVISDHADEAAPETFAESLGSIAAASALGIVRELMEAGPVSAPIR
ncbi:MAG: 5'-methylthioadenosine/adenosylhomocysteine nucleosidase [Planctomycetota bacterium]